MDIFLIRHAIAVERSPDLDDAERPLSERGVRRFAQEVRALARLGIAFDRVFHSPWLRAAQTAEMLAPVTKGERRVTELLADDPGSALIDLAAQAAAEVAKDLAGEDPDARVAFVGHEPWMAEFLSLLLFADVSHGPRMPFKKGGVAWLTGAPRAGGLELCAVLPPKMLRRLVDDTESP